MTRTLIPMTAGTFATYSLLYGGSWSLVQPNPPMMSLYSFTYPAASHQPPLYYDSLAPLTQPILPASPVLGDGQYMLSTTSGDTMTITIPAGQGFTGALLLCRMDYRAFAPTITVNSGGVVTTLPWTQWNTTNDNPAYDRLRTYQPFLYKACSPPLYFANPSAAQTITLTAGCGVNDQGTSFCGATFVGAEFFTASAITANTLMAFGHSIVYGSYLYGSLDPTHYPGVNYPGSYDPRANPAYYRFGDKLAGMLGILPANTATRGYPSQSINDQPAAGLASTAPPPGWLFVDDARIFGTQTVGAPTPAYGPMQYAVIMHGFNDNLNLDVTSGSPPPYPAGYSSKRLMQRLRDAVYRINLDTATAAAPTGGTRIVLANITYDDHDAGGVGYEQYRVAANAMMAQIATDPLVRNTAYAPCRAAMVALSPPGGGLVGGVRYTVPLTMAGAPTWQPISGSSPLMTQGFGEHHPNGLGTGVIAQAIFTTIKARWG